MLWNKFRHTSATKLGCAVAPVLESLEGRRLLSASANDEFLSALQSHSLTQEQMDANGISSMTWQGKQTYVRKGEWIVSLETPEPTYGPDGELISLNVKWAGRDRRAPEIQAVLDKTGSGLNFERYLGSEDVFLVTAPAQVTGNEVSTALRALNGVQQVSPNVIGWITATPNDPNFNLQYGLHNTGQTGGTSDADIDAPAAWDKTHGYTGTVVGVIDTGVNYNHPDLAANIWSNPNEIAGNGVDDDSNGFIDDIRGWDFANNDNNPMDDHAALE